MRPLGSVVPCTTNCQAAVLPGQRLCSCTPTPAAGLPRLVSSMCVVIGERPASPFPTAQHRNTVRPRLMFAIILDAAVAAPRLE